MKKTFIIVAILAFYSCNTDKKSPDTEYYKQVETDFNKVKELTKNRADALYKVFDQQLSDDESRYLKFLYAYMPLSDLADLDGDFFLAQVRTSLEARNYFSWGDSIPEDVFRHFVLPYRVNNEYPDSARQVFYVELRDRVKNMDMYNAALEVNHWCHEKVCYRGTDERTIAPLDAYKSGFGRCGEESTFAVTALRSVGIPARQVYTPRWAHCDDNHAWVEVWVNGKWYFMGACEPEAKLNRGWFQAPALRAMLVHTRVFGKYADMSNQMVTKNNHSIINVIDTYIKPVKYNVFVNDASGKAVKDAVVQFGLYNYAEFYPIAKLNTDDKGFCTLNTNHGTLLISVEKEGSSAYSAFRVDDSKATDTLTLKLSKTSYTEFEEKINVVVPVEAKLNSETEDNSGNQCRLKSEDSVRNAFAMTFPDDKLIFVFAETNELDQMVIGEHIKLSCGNYPEMMKFIETASKTDKEKCLQMLEMLNEKDHRDMSSEAMLDCFNNTKNLGFEQDIYLNFVLNPRIYHEKLKAYRSYFLKSFRNTFIDSCRSNPQLISNYVKQNVKIDDEWNYYGVTITPQGVHELKIADTKSRNVYFVGICRSFGIPARLNPINYQPEYYAKNKWIAAAFEAETTVASPVKASLTLNHKNKNLKYYSDFTIARYQKGAFVTLDYGWDTPLGNIEMPMIMDTGYYAIMSGKRLPNGDVLVWRKFVELKSGESPSIELAIRQPDELLKIGKIEAFDKIKNGLISENYLFIWIDTGKEPGKHVLNELTETRNQFAKKNIRIILFTNAGETGSTTNLKAYNLPEGTTSINETGKEFYNDIKLDKIPFSNTLPIVIYCNKKGEILYFQSGYKVGMANQILGIIN